MSGEEISKELRNTQSLDKLNLLRLSVSDSSNVKDGIYFPFFPLSNKRSGRGLLGRNWGVCKNDLIKVNGFDMDYVHAGVGEDVDIEWRLKANGMKSISLKNKAIVYHLYHSRGYTDEAVQINYKLFDQKKAAHQIVCINGLNALIEKQN